MKYQLTLIAITLAGGCNAAQATEYGTVISSVAVTAQVAVPQQQCTEQQATVPQRTSGGGALLGALVGGVVGHNIGDGFGRAAATGLGAVVGSAIGDRTEAANTPAVQVPVRTCQTVTQYHNQTVGYDVTYEYRGQRYSARLAQDPGERIALNVSVAPAGAPAPTAQPLATAPAVIYAPSPVYGYYADPGPVVTIAPRLVYGGYWRHGYGGY